MQLHHIFSMHSNCVKKCLIEFELVMYILKHHNFVHVMLLYICCTLVFMCYGLVAKITIKHLYLYLYLQGFGWVIRSMTNSNGCQRDHLNAIKHCLEQ